MNENTEEELHRGMGHDADAVDLFTAEDQLTTEPLAPNECPECHKVFSNPMGLRMHNARVHTRTLIARGGKGFKSLGSPAATPEEKRQAKRVYQKRLRARYYREGKNSRGIPMPPGWKPRTSKGHGVKWTPEQHAKFRKTWLSKARKRNREILMEQPKTGRIQKIVYPNPHDQPYDREEADRKGEEIIAAFEKSQQLQATNSTIRFCPHCGTNIQKHL